MSGDMDQKAAAGSVRYQLTGLLRIAVRQLRSERARTALAVIGIAVAVVLVTVMTGLGYGMLQTGTEALTYIDQDLWATATPPHSAPTQVDGVRNTLLNAHEIQRDIAARPAVTNASVLAFHTVYVSSTPDNFTTVVGVGIAGTGIDAGLQPDGSHGPRPSGRDPHYAHGRYTGPMTRTVVLNHQTATRLNVSTGDTVYLGGTRATAHRQSFTVVRISDQFTNFVGAPTAVVPLSELQTVTGTTGSDRAALIGMQVTDDANTAAVATAIERRHPTLRVRTQRQQFRAVFKNQGAILASAATLVILAVIVGIGLVANTLGLVVYQQRRELAALRALGVRTRMLVGIVATQGLVLSVLGAGIGLAATPVITEVVNNVVNRVVGFPNLIQLPVWVFGVGSAVALGIGLVGACLAGVRLAHVQPEVYLNP